MNSEAQASARGHGGPSEARSANSVPDDDPEAQLIARARAGDDLAFAELVQPHAPGLFRLLCGIVRDPAEAEDLLQDTLLRAWVKLPTFRRQGAFSRWLRAIARNAGLNALRARNGRQRVQPVESPPERADVRCPETRTLANERLARIERLFHDLTPEQQEVFLLRMLSQLTFREIADRQGVPLNTALGRMYSVRQRLSEVG
jgi:RNA polymerase sigma-70 factor (ECF subfamily)